MFMVRINAIVHAMEQSNNILMQIVNANYATQFVTHVQVQVIYVMVVTLLRTESSVETIASAIQWDSMTMGPA